MTMLIVNAFIVMNENVYVRTDSPTLFLSVERESVYNTPAKPHGLDRERTAETSRTHSYLHIIIRREVDEGVFAVESPAKKVGIF